jgi:hypothetical protein|tara:strand:+ start:22 stop:354 length:333 start_codon:yes stop_codon:yes gene_type:complete
MTEPVIKMVGLANDDKPNAVADIFGDEMMDRVAGNVQAAKDVIANSMFDQELEIEIPDEIEQPEDVEVEGESEQEVLDQPEEEESETFEADQEILAEPDDQQDESEESED